MADETTQAAAAASHTGDADGLRDVPSDIVEYEKFVAAGGNEHNEKLLNRDKAVADAKAAGILPENPEGEEQQHKRGNNFQRRVSGLTAKNRRTRSTNPRSRSANRQRNHRCRRDERDARNARGRAPRGHCVRRRQTARKRRSENAAETEGRRFQNVRRFHRGADGLEDRPQARSGRGEKAAGAGRTGRGRQREDDHRGA